MHRITVIVPLVLTAILARDSTAQQWTTIDLSTWANARIQNYQPGAAAYPEGSVVLGSVPFEIRAVGANNAWNAEMISGPQPHILNVPIGVCGAVEVYTLINTFYGQPGPQSFISLEFFGSNGGYHRKDLIGNVDVRDHFYGGWTNSINNTTTVNVFTTGGGLGSENRLDMQQIVLPVAFAQQVLNSMRITSTGGVLISDASIQGLTIHSTSGPGCGQGNSPCATLTVNGLGATGSGPFAASVPAGTAMNLAWSGAANQPLALVASPTLAVGQNLGNGVIVDLDLATASVLFSGLGPIGALLFSTNASQGAYGTSSQSFNVPQSAAGGTMRMQGVVFDLSAVCPGPGYMTTATFVVSF